MLFFLSGKFPQWKIFADLLDQLLPVAFCVCISLVLSCALPVRIRKDWLEIAQIVVVLLPFAQKLPEGVKEILLIFNPQLELTLLNFGILANTVDYCDLFVDFSRDGPIVLCEVIKETFACMSHALPPEATHSGHLRVKFHLLFRFKHDFLQ